ncbi:MAG TPA: glutamate synthase-related protein [Blastocatellia bacterium]|nr:glutamate synthase-related protein [Blastocatellia bacterium]
MTLLEQLGIEDERDACAIIACVKRDGRASHGNVKRTLDALTKMGHRTGEIAGEGDGAGIQTDIPREIWLHHLESRGLIGSTVNHPYFTVSHLLAPAAAKADHDDIKRRAVEIFETRGMEIVLEQDAQVRREALGPLGRANEPLFWQLAAIPRGARRMGNRETFHIHLALERELPVYVASLSHTSVVYKIRGDAEALRRYFPELSRPDFKSAITLGHGRYSTNTNSAAEKAQMFSTLGHNGEINSIDRLTREAVALGFQLPASASDSQILDRVVECLMFNYGLSLMETVEIIFPPVWSESEKYDTPLKPFHRYFRRAFGSLAQGPAAIIAREGDEVVFCCDALGLRPLWFGKTEKEYFASSEKGVVPLEAMAENPRPLAPGEKMGLLVKRDREVEVFEAPQMQRRIHEMSSERYDFHWLNEVTMNSSLFSFNFDDEVEKAEEEKDEAQQVENESPEDALAVEEQQKERAIKIERTLAATDALAAMGWTKEEVDNLMTMVTGKDPLSGLGYDGPLAAFSKVRRNLSDYFHERVAVVTNPAIDRVREGDHFSVRVFLGARPSLAEGGSIEQQIELKSPILLGGAARDFLPAHAMVAKEFGTCLIDDIAREFSESVEGLKLGSNPFSAESRLKQLRAGLAGEKLTGLVARTIDITYDEGETLASALERVRLEARDAVSSGVTLLILDDSRAYEFHELFIDASLALAAVDQALNSPIEISVSGCAVTSDVVSGLVNNGFGHSDSATDSSAPEQESLRRKCGIVLKSGQIRNLHDICFALGAGADAVAPYAMYEVALRDAVDTESARTALRNLFVMQHTGIEKVMSTMGIHEVDGYGRLFASIGLGNEVANIFGIKNYCGSDRVGLTLERLDRELRDRLAARREQAKKGATRLSGTSGLMREYRRQPYVWSAAGKVARKEERYENFLQKLAEIEESAPVSLRHLLDLQERSIVTRNLADTKIGAHSAPIFIAAMSFGSQGETTFRAYAEAAKRLKIVAMNGEGGEIPDMMGRYKEYRGQQVASGRFGVNIHLLNCADFIEIKIGQGAKPGEGGHLPGMKVTELIAKTRHTPQGIDLLSPSNNHDIYSIEDLAQVIAELKTANPHAKVSVKIPAVPFIGPIATGIAKARADIIAVSGYDGGTGAARKHALRHVGMPVEIGVKEAHRALLKAGLRDRVEVWADGGIKSGADVIKLMLLGANRVGFGTMAMAAVGCTSCRECNQGTCHVGITAHHQSVEKAKEAGLKKYTPRDYDKSVDALVTFFKEVINEVGIWTMRLGFHRTQELVGRSDLMRQTRGLDQIDLEYLLKGIEFAEAFEPEKLSEDHIGRAYRPRTSLTKIVSDEIYGLIEQGKSIAIFEDDKVTSVDRSLGTHLSGKLSRAKYQNKAPAHFKLAKLHFTEGSISGNGLGAYNIDGVDIIVEGGVQDSAAKSSCGGTIAVLKGMNHDGIRFDGSVGKCFGYGAQGGTLIVQGDADSRAGIRLSGADLIIAGKPRGPLTDDLGCIASRANIKGFAFEYMTSGRGMVLGDPGPWLCSGMTGGVVYLKLDEDLGLDIDALRRRLAKGAEVEIVPVKASEDEKNVREMLTNYIDVLSQHEQKEEADAMRRLLRDWQSSFVKAAPRRK